MRNRVQLVTPQVAKQTESVPAKKTCPVGFILIPGSLLYHTSDFCVMKYDAKCADIINLTTGLQPEKTSACAGKSGSVYNGTYKNDGPGCACTGTRQIVSTPSGFPVTFIPASDNSPDNAKKYCTSLGWHLMTNNEWMTIARNVEQQDSNWCDSNGTNCGYPPGTKGKILANGHYDTWGEASASGSVHGALIAGSDNEPCFGTTTNGSNLCGGISSQKRTLELSNSEIIWDFAGNVWQWVDAVVMLKDEPKSATHGKPDSGWLKSDFAPGSLASVITDNGYGSSLGYDAFRPSNPTWNANNGVGRIYHFSSPTNSTALYGFIRGGNWRHGSDDGAFTIHLSPPLDRAHIDDVGFRCVSPL